MTDEQGLLRAIRDNRGDDTPRLIYADWRGVDRQA